jgi:hypothetical protein
MRSAPMPDNDLQFVVRDVRRIQELCPTIFGRITAQPAPAIDGAASNRAIHPDNCPRVGPAVSL